MYRDHDRRAGTTGAGAVVMVEHCVVDAGTMRTERTIESGANVAEAGCEARAGVTMLPRGTRIDHSHIAWLATIGLTNVPVYRRPAVAILATGDEIVGIDEEPGLAQIRNSNTYALAAQVQRAGGVPILLPVARDNMKDTVSLLHDGFAPICFCSPAVFPPENTTSWNLLSVSLTRNFTSTGS